MGSWQNDLIIPVFFEDKRRDGGSFRGQSEVVGVVLVTVLIVLLVGLVGPVIVTVAESSGPTVAFDFEVTETEVTLTHDGGDALSVDDVTVILRTEYGTVRPTLSADRGDAVDVDDGRFGPGDTWIHAHPGGDVVTVTVVHDPSGTVLFERDGDTDPAWSSR